MTSELREVKLSSSATHPKEEEHRFERLGRVLEKIGPLANRIVALNDHKGILTVTWKSRPLPEEEDDFHDAWGAEEEPEDMVCHVISTDLHDMTGCWTYSEYLKSGEWKSRREHAIIRARHRCQVCNTPEEGAILDVHHRTYENLGNEMSADLIVLCRGCHRLFHQNGRLAR
jgi:hypothetical protein